MVDLFRIRVVLVGRGALHRGRCMYLVGGRQLKRPAGAWRQPSMPKYLLAAAAAATAGAAAGAAAAACYLADHR
jgi:hypothetical protein